MNKKLIAAIIVLALVIVGGYFFLYAPYQENILNENYNSGLQNASSVETQVIALTEKFNNQQSTDVDTLMNTINNEIIPKYSDEIATLEETGKQSNGNETKTKYIELQTKRLELESKNLNATVTTLNAISQYVKGEKSAEDAQNSINKANTDMTESQKELESVYVDIKTLLTQNPGFNQTLQELHLEKPYYGEKRVQANTQNISNTTNTTNTTQ